MRICSIDIESTGLSEECDILEFGAVLDDSSKPHISVKDLPTFHCYFTADTYNGEPYALSMHPVIFRRIAEREPGFTYVNPFKFGNMFKNFLIDNGYTKSRDLVYINVAGKNPGSMDMPFLTKKTDVAKHVRMRHKVLDPGIMWMKHSDESIPGLGECKKRAGLPEEVAHNAIDDAIDVVKLLRKGWEWERECEKHVVGRFEEINMETKNRKG
jgi:hypothetical protein